MKIEDHPAFQSGNFKAKCVLGSPNTTVGKVYTVKNGVFTFDDGQCCEEQNSIDQLNCGLDSHFELVTEPELPRMCYVIGSEENPIKIGEEFEFDGGKYQMDKDGVACSGGALWPAPHKIFEMINHPEKIIRRPQFSDDEKALFKAFHSIGFDFWIRIRTGVFACTAKPIPKGEEFDFDENERVWALPEAALPHLKLGNMVDASDYLESEESK